MINKALKICYEAHLNQVDKGGNPYYLHPIQVALMCDTEQEKITALLHDVVEDTDYTLNDLIEHGFDKEVIKAIKCLTKIEGLSYDEYFKNILNNPIARKVKLNDMIHNSDLSRINNVTITDLERVEKYKKYIDILRKKD